MFDRLVIVFDLSLSLFFASLCGIVSHLYLEHVKGPTEFAGEWRVEAGSL